MDKDYENFVSRMGSFGDAFEIGEDMSNPDELKHYGVLGMRWGIRRQTRMVNKAERKLGRKVNLVNDFGGGKITNKGIKKVKEYDKMESRYKKVRQKGDPALDYMTGIDATYNIQLSRKTINKIIAKVEKDPSTTIKREYTLAKGNAFVKKYGRRSIKSDAYNTYLSY